MSPAAKSLKKWIDDNKSSQTALGEQLGVSQPSVFAWLKGSARPVATLRVAIETLTGIPATDWEKKSERAKREKMMAALTKGAA